MNTLAELISALRAGRLPLAEVLAALRSRGARPAAEHAAEVAALQQLADGGGMAADSVAAIIATLREVQAPPADADATQPAARTVVPPPPPSPPKPAGAVNAGIPVTLAGTVNALTPASTVTVRPPSSTCVDPYGGAVIAIVGEISTSTPESNTACMPAITAVRARSASRYSTPV